MRWWGPLILLAGLLYSDAAGAQHSYTAHYLGARSACIAHSRFHDRRGYWCTSDSIAGWLFDVMGNWARVDITDHDWCIVDGWDWEWCEKRTVYGQATCWGWGHWDWFSRAPYAVRYRCVVDRAWEVDRMRIGPPF